MTLADTIEPMPVRRARRLPRRALAAVGLAWLVASACAAWPTAGPAAPTPADVLREGAESAHALEVAWTIWYVRATGAATTPEAVEALTRADARFAALLWDYRRTYSARAQGHAADPDVALGRVLALMRAMGVELPAPWSP